MEIQTGERKGDILRGETRKFVIAGSLTLNYPSVGIGYYVLKESGR
jgi:hypothetical protein